MDLYNVLLVAVVLGYVLIKRKIDLDHGLKKKVKKKKKVVKRRKTTSRRIKR